jgi:hypothetical protein
MLLYCWFFVNLFFKAKVVTDYQTFQLDDHCCHKYYALGQRKFEISKVRYRLIKKNIYLSGIISTNGNVYICLTKYGSMNKVICSVKVLGEEYIDKGEFLIGLKIDDVEYSDIILYKEGCSPIILDLHYNN